MKYLIGLCFMFCFASGWAQFIPANIKIDASLGNHFKHSQITDGYRIKQDAPHNLLLGLSYLFRNNLSFRGEAAADLNRPADGSLYFKNDYFRTTFGVSADILQIRLKSSEEFKNAARLWQDKFKVHGYFGIGLSAMVNKMKYDADYGKKIFLYDYMLNFTGSLMPTYYFNRYTSVFLRISMTGHIRQAYNFDLMDYNPNDGFDGGFMNAGIGFAFTPFKSMLGARAIN